MKSRASLARMSSVIIIGLLLFACGIPETEQPATTAPTTAASYPTAAPVATQSGPLSADVVQPADFEYLGAFRLPDDGERPLTFAYGGNAMTFNPDGIPLNSDDHPGSLFIVGHERLAYGELPDGSQIAEINIPAPVLSADLGNLPQAEFIQNFHDTTTGFFTQLEEIPKVGMQYLNHPDTGPLIHLSWGQHLQLEDAASHIWFNAALDTPDTQGAWFIGEQNLYAVNGYMFDIPASWADAHAQGRYLATGRFRDGGQGGMGPALFAYRPWLSDGSAPPPGTRLQETVLLLYENSYVTEAIERNMNGYQHPDEWEGGAWITTQSSKSAVLFAGTKSNGTRYWYGYLHPSDPNRPCVHTESIGEFRTCITSDGQDCPAEDFEPCSETASERGWWSTHFEGQFILYDPADLAQVAAGTMEPWEPQPYASLSIEEHLFQNPSGIEEVLIGSGVQRRYKVGPVAYDRDNDLLYVLEWYADEAKPVVHVWSIN